MPNHTISGTIAGVPALALALVIVAAALHAGWNLLLKQVDEKYIVNWWSVLFSAALSLPVIFAGGLPQPEAWPLLIASALTEVAYMAALAAAYNLSDFSLVYPVARGAAPAFLALWSILFLGERLTLTGAAGLALVIGGLMLVGSNELLQKRAPKHQTVSQARPDHGAGTGIGDRAADLDLLQHWMRQRSS